MTTRLTLHELTSGDGGPFGTPAAAAVVAAATDIEWMSTVTWTIARGIASTGRRVALVDLCITRPVLRRHAVQRVDQGIVDAFMFGVSLSRVATPQGVNRLYFIDVGTEPGDPHEVWRNPRWERLIRGFKNEQATIVALVPPEAIPVSPLRPDEFAVLNDGGSLPHETELAVMRWTNAGIPCRAIIDHRPPQPVPPPVTPADPEPAPPTPPPDSSTPSPPQPVPPSAGPSPEDRADSREPVTPAEPFSPPLDELDAEAATTPLPQTGPDPSLSPIPPEYAPDIDDDEFADALTLGVDALPSAEPEVAPAPVPSPASHEPPAPPPFEMPSDGPSPELATRPAADVSAPSVAPPAEPERNWMPLRIGAIAAVGVAVVTYALTRPNDPEPEPGRVLPPPADTGLRIVVAEEDESADSALVVDPDVPVPIADSLFFSIQVAAFNVRDRALDLAAELETLDRPTTVNPVRLGDRGLWFRVMVGAFPSPQEADEIRQQLWEEDLVERGVGTIVRTPHAYHVATHTTPDAARAASQGLRERGIPTYVLLASDGVRVLAGAFENPGQAAELELMLADAGLPTTLAQRMGILP